LFTSSYLKHHCAVNFIKDSQLILWSLLVANSAKIPGVAKLSEVKRMYVLAAAVQNVAWGERRAKVFRDLTEGRSSYQIAESLNSSGMKCSVANIKKIMTGKSATVPLDFALSMCGALSINPYALLPLLEIVENRNFKDPIDIAT
jgi:hypothetical protein